MKNRVGISRGARGFRGAVGGLQQLVHPVPTYSVCVYALCVCVCSHSGCAHNANSGSNGPVIKSPNDPWSSNRTNNRKKPKKKKETRDCTHDNIILDHTGT